MLALIRMDWILSRPVLLRASPILGLILWLGLSTPKGGVLMAAYLLAILAMGYPLFHDLGPHTLEPYVCALPVSRSQIVAARYASALVTLLLALLLPLGFGLGARALGLNAMEGLPLEDAILGLAALGLILSALLFLYLPFHFRFGGERGLGAFAGSGFAGLLLLFFALGGRSLLTHSFEPSLEALERLPVRLGVLAAWLSLGGASLALSRASYQRRLAARQAPGLLPFLLLAAVLLGLYLALR
jgi:hypothetical protein